MAIWPFGRSKKSKNARNAPAEQQQTRDLDEKAAVREEHPVTPTTRRPTRPSKVSPKSAKTSIKGSKTFSRSRSRARSQSAAQQPEEDLPFGTTTSITGGAHHPTVKPVPPSPSRQRSLFGRSKNHSPERSRPPPPGEVENPAGTRSAAAASTTSLQEDEDFTAIPIIPTLAPWEKIKPSDNKLLRRKSSKEKAIEKQRLEHLKELSRTAPIPIPKRPVSDAGSILVRDSLPAPAPNWSRRPMSEISLPLSISLQDSAPDRQSENTSYKLSPFDVLAPRPTIRYNNHPRYLRSAHGREKEPVLPETDEDWSSRARMNELADGLDASGLRELMDRDRRRRERKRKLQAEKLVRKLERRAQREEEAKKAASEGKGKGKTNEVPQAREVIDQLEDAGLAMLAAAAAKVADEQPQQVADDPFLSAEDDPRHRLRMSKVSRLSHRSGDSRSSPVSPVSPLDDPFQDRDDDAVIETAQAVQYSQPSLSPPASPVAPQYHQQSSLSDINPRATPDIPEVPGSSTQVEPELRRNSRASSRKGGRWASIFRRGQKESRTSSERGRATPSESGFSNASRESFARTGPGAAAEAAFVRTGGSGGPQQTIVPQRSFKKSTTPQRTRSKFREELPDATDAIPPVPSTMRATTPPPPVPEKSTSRPQSPPLSRVASPEAGSGPPSPFVDNPHMLSTDAAINAPMEDVHPALRNEVALSRGPSMSSHRNSSAAAAAGSAALLSQSLASVDSEGSWLSGRPSKRSSTITGRPSSNSIGAGYFDEDGRGASSGSPLMFARRTSSPTPRGNGGSGAAAGAQSSISTQLRALRNPSVTSETRIADEKAVPTPDSSVLPTPTRLSTLPSPQDQLEEDDEEEEGAVYHTATVARSPTIVQRANAARSREGLLDIFDPQPSTAILESGESPGSQQEGEGDEAEGKTPTKLTRRSSSGESAPEGAMEAELAEIKRATSVKLKGDRGHARQMSAGSARLLDISRRASGEGSKFSEGKRLSVGSSAKMSELAIMDSRESGRGSRLAQTTSAEPDDEPEAQEAEVAGASTEKAATAEDKKETTG